MTTTNARAEVLRAAGHRDAADLLDSLSALEQQAKPEPEPQAPTQPPQAMTAEQAREAEGQAVLAALYRSCPQFMPDAETTT